MKGFFSGIGGIVSVAVVLGVGGAILTGFQVERTIKDQLRTGQDKLNEQFVNFGLERDKDITFEVSLASFKRGLFSSKATYRVQVIPKARPGRATDLIFSDTIEHGPWPVSRLKQLELMPVMTTSNIKMMPALPLQSFFDRFDKEKGPLSLSLSYGYDGSISYNGELSTALFEDGDSSFRFSDIPFSGHVSSALGLNEVAVTVPRLELTNKGTYISITDLILDAKYKTDTTVLPVGEWSITLADASVRTPSSSISVRDLANKYVGSETSSGIHSMSDSIDVPDIRFNGEALGGFELAVSAKNIRAKDLIALAEAIKNRETTSVYEQQAIDEAIEGNIYMLLDGNPSVAIDTFSYKNASGQSSVSLVVDLQQPTGKIGDTDALVSAIAGIKLESSTSKSMLEFIAQSISNESKDYSDMPNMIAGSIVASGYGTIEGDNIVSRISYKSEGGGIINNNGKESSVQQLAQSDPLLGEFLNRQKQLKPQQTTPAQRAQYAEELVQASKDQRLTPTYSQQQPQISFPRFEDYPSGPQYTGGPAALDLSNETANMFRTRLRQALPGLPVFAGEYVDAGWGCGTTCYSITFVNKRTGKILDQGFGGEQGPWITEVRPDSKLIRAEGYDSEWDQPERYFASFYVLTAGELNLITKVEIPHLTADQNPGSDDTYSYLENLVLEGQRNALEKAYMQAEAMQSTSQLTQQASQSYLAKVQPSAPTQSQEQLEAAERNRKDRVAAEARKAESLAELLGGNTKYQQAMTDTPGDLDDLLINLISNQWRRPDSARNGMRVELLIEMLPDGTISNASVTRSSGDRPFDNSAVAAVRNVGRIPEMTKLDRATFDHNYRMRRVIFTPEDLSR
jgi:TonB family protein